MNLLLGIHKLMRKYGKEEEQYRLSIPNVYVNYGTTDINVFIEDGIGKIQFPLGYVYKLTALSNLELFSIMDSIKKFYEIC